MNEKKDKKSQHSQNGKKDTSSRRPSIVNDEHGNFYQSGRSPETKLGHSNRSEGQRGTLLRLSVWLSS